ncbi:MAG: TolC family protein [Gammaproteobacteria bacterium]|nr:TolC family protein [Gammaproteobacteria bacterium]
MRFRVAVATFFWLLVADASAVPLTLGEAVARVLESNPQLQAADFDARAAAERIRQQGQSTPYTVGLELENLAGSGEASGVRGLETTLSLGRVLESGGKAQRRGEVARLEAGLLRHAQDARRLDLLAETARRFLTLARVQAERELAEERVELMRRTQHAVERRHRAGKAADAERGRAQIALARAELALEETDHLLFNGRRDLAVLWGVFPPAFERVHAELVHLEAEPTFDELEQRLARNPAVAQLATAERLAEARRQLAHTRARPDVEAQAGVRHLNASDDVGLVLSLRLPLGSAGRAAAYEAEAAALAAREPLLAQDRRLALRAALSSLHQELLHARDRLEAYQERILPAARKVLDDYSQGYAAGRYSLLELSAAQESLLEARLEVLSAAVEYHAARIEIDRLIGVAPAGSASPIGVEP